MLYKLILTSTLKLGQLYIHWAILGGDCPPASLYYKRFEVYGVATYMEFHYSSLHKNISNEWKLGSYSIYTSN